MLSKVNDQKDIDEVLAMILSISRDIKNIKSQLDILSERVALIDEKVFKANAISYDSTRNRSLDVSISMDRVKDD